MSSALARATFDRVLASPIDRHTDDGLYRETSEVARTLGWATTYDAEYLALARTLQVDLLSRDQRLRRGATQLVEVITPDELVPPEHPTESQ